VCRFEGEPPQGRIVEIIEKPKKAPSNYAVTGIYFYDPDVFTMCKALKPSGRGELEITDVNNAYLARGDLTYEILEGWWTDAGTFESLHRAASFAVDGGANHAEFAAAVRK
jgi:glucose-1-phosphate thymidylyltransferase